jgi:hypothetical protein
VSNERCRQLRRPHCFCWICQLLASRRWLFRHQPTFHVCGNAKLSGFSDGFGSLRSGRQLFGICQHFGCSGIPIVTIDIVTRLFHIMWMRSSHRSALIPPQAHRDRRSRWGRGMPKISRPIPPDCQHNGHPALSDRGGGVCVHGLLRQNRLSIQIRMRTRPSALGVACVVPQPSVLGLADAAPHPLALELAGSSEGLRCSSVLGRTSGFRCSSVLEGSPARSSAWRRCITIIIAPFC